jgi:small subunit ribosomal protein S20
LPIEKSAYKELRKAKKRHFRNIAATTELKTLVKKFESLVSAKKADEAKAFLRIVASKIAKAASKGIIHRNTASRKISRLTKRLSSPAKA